MPLNIRTYHDLTEPDRSGLPDQIGAQRRRVAERLATVGRVVAGVSGEGGGGGRFVAGPPARPPPPARRAPGAARAAPPRPPPARPLGGRGGPRPRPGA